MRNANDCLLNLKPVKKYRIPKYPVYMQAYDNPELLKKLPSRWQNNAKVIGCLSVMGVLTMTGCSQIFGPGPGPGPGSGACSKCGFSHFGGSGGAPIYVVYLTEQEALTLIRTKAETEGLSLNSEPPDYKVNVWWQEVGLDLYNEEKDVAVALVGPKESGWHWCAQSKDMAAEARKEFAKLETSTTIGVLHNPEKPFGFSEPDAKAAEEAKKALREQLVSQVIEFIERLQNQ